MQGYDYDTMAEMLNIKVTTLRPSVNRARKILREKIEKEEREYKLVA